MAAASAYQQESVDNTLIESFCNDLIVRYGSIVKAWRRVLDPNRHGELLFNEFVEGLARTSYHGDTSALWMALLRRARARGKDHALALFEFSPQSSTLMETFRQWTIAKFGGPIHMFKAMVSSSNAAVTLDQFVEICRAHEFTEDAERIFIDAFDLHNSGLITVDDIAFLEADGFKRRAAIEPTFIMQIEKGKEKQAKVISRQAAKKKAQDAANREFQQRVRAVSGGSFIRGWRNILDLDGNMTISKCELLKACKKIAFKGEVAALWKAIDLDDDGAVHLHEWETIMAMAMARFKKWVQDLTGEPSCVAALHALAAKERPRNRYSKWTLDAFCNAVLPLEPPEVPGMTQRQVVSLVHEACDLAGVGSIVADDSGFLDRWVTPVFLCADPDGEGAERFIRALTKRYGTLTVAWRKILDVNNKNRVTFERFDEACKVMNFKNSANIWCSLDDDASGFITLDEIDHESADVLLAFKEWAEETFGTIGCAFRMLDSTRSNAMSFQMWKRALQDLGFVGDARILFQIFKPESGSSAAKDARLSLDDIRYLSTWEPPDVTPDSESQDADEGCSPRSETADAPPSCISLARKAAKDTSPRMLSKAISLPLLPTTPFATIERSIAAPQDRVNYSRLGAQFIYCKSADEYKELNKLRRQRPQMHAPRGTFDIESYLKLPPPPKPGVAMESLHTTGFSVAAEQTMRSTMGMRRNKSQASPYATGFLK